MNPMSLQNAHAAAVYICRELSWKELQQFSLVNAICRTIVTNYVKAYVLPLLEMPHHPYTLFKTVDVHTKTIDSSEDGKPVRCYYFKETGYSLQRNFALALLASRYRPFMIPDNCDIVDESMQESKKIVDQSGHTLRVHIEGLGSCAAYRELCFDEVSVTPFDDASSSRAEGENVWQSCYALREQKQVWNSKEEWRKPIHTLMHHLLHLPNVIDSEDIVPYYFMPKLELFIQMGANVNAKNANGETPLNLVGAFLQTIYRSEYDAETAEKIRTHILNLCTLLFEAGATGNLGVDLPEPWSNANQQLLQDLSSLMMEYTNTIDPK